MKNQNGRANPIPPVIAKAELMSADPFQTNNNAQLMREATVGLILVVLLLALFVYLAARKISGAGADLLRETEPVSYTHLTLPTKA